MSLMPVTKPAMNLEAFQDIIDQFGEDPAHWPEAQRESAEALLESDPAARALVAEAAAIRAGLQRRTVKAPERLLQAIDNRLRDPEQRAMQPGVRASARS